MNFKNPSLQKIWKALKVAGAFLLFLLMLYGFAIEGQNFDLSVPTQAFP